MDNQVLVYGYYNNNNLGDELFKLAFQKIFPTLKFQFTNYINTKLANQYNVFFFGGGSFLDGAPQISKDALDILNKKKIFYIGVGAETSIHPVHKDLLKIAKHVFFRSEDNESLLDLNKNLGFIPDLVYILKDKRLKSNKYKNSILIIPNATLIAKYNDPVWKHAAWQSFKIEYSQFITDLSKNNCINYFSMCLNDYVNDEKAMHEIQNQMNKSIGSFITYEIDNDYGSIYNLITVFSKYEVVISQRYHGVILSQLANTNYLAICHHDKFLKANNINKNKSINYYGLSKNILHDKFNKIKNLPLDEVLDYKKIFDDMAKIVLNYL